MKKILGITLAILFLKFLFSFTDKGKFIRCNNLFSLESHDSVVAGCYQDLGFKAKDIEVCNKAKDVNQKRASCIIGVAMVNSNPSTCNSITNESDRDYCLASSNERVNNPQVCDLIKGIDLKNACNANVGKSKNDVSYCNKIDPITDEIGQRNGCIFSIAKNLNDKSLCNLLKDSKSSESYCLDSFKN